MAGYFRNCGCLEKARDLAECVRPSVGLALDKLLGHGQRGRLSAGPRVLECAGDRGDAGEPDA